jgi:chemotaxis protein histidine kinase CheA
MTDPRRARYVALFAAESRSLLASAQRSLSTWLDGPAEKGPAEEIFRALHTIKGMSASLGFDDLTAQVHEAETVLAEVRSGEKVADRRWLSSLEEILDRIAAGAEQVIAAEHADNGDQKDDGRGRKAQVVRVDLDRLDGLLEDLGALVTARQELEWRCRVGSMRCRIESFTCDSHRSARCSSGCPRWCATWPANWART